MWSVERSHFLSLHFNLTEILSNEKKTRLLLVYFVYFLHFDQHHLKSNANPFVDLLLYVRRIGIFGVCVYEFCNCSALKSIIVLSCCFVFVRLCFVS